MVNRIQTIRDSSCSYMYSTLGDDDAVRNLSRQLATLGQELTDETKYHSIYTRRLGRYSKIFPMTVQKRGLVQNGA